MGARISDALTAFSGSWLFVGLHAAWWALWFGLALNVDLLTLAVSLEAILLSTILLMSQNRAAERDHAEAARDRIRHQHVEQIAERIERLETAQFSILRHLERLSTHPAAKR